MSAIHEKDRAFMLKGSPSKHGSSLPSRTTQARNQLVNKGKVSKTFMPR